MADDEFDSKITDEALGLLLGLGGELGFDPLGSLELESYFHVLLEAAAQRPDASEPLGTWLGKRVRPAFRSVAEKPAWVKTGEWPLYDGRPMVFIGQLTAESAPGIVSRNTTFYVFLDPASSETTTIIQDP